MYYIHLVISRINIDANISKTISKQKPEMYKIACDKVKFLIIQ